MDHILKMEDINKAFPGVVALDKMSLYLERGRIMALLGENGAGKSTLIKILSGAYAPDGGRIFLDGGQYSSMTPAKAIAAGVSVIYQELNLVPQLSVCENIFLGREPLKNGFVDKGEMFDRTLEILDSLGISISPGTLVKNLSVGFQQLVEVAKAIARNAKVLVLDEPTSALSNAETQNLFGILRGLKDRGVSMIYISHRLEEVFEICDCATVMRDGALVGVTEIAETSREELIGMMVGRTLSETFPAGGAAPSGEMMLEVKNLCGGPVRDVSFELYKGEILGFAGLVGAGRTETARVLFGADSPASGEILVGGEQVRIRNPADAIAAGIGFIPEDRKRQGLNLIASISDNIAVANLDSLKSGPLLSSKKERELANKYVRYLGIKTPSIHKKTVELSGGNQQKVVLAKWLAKRCRVLILDEPTRGVDVGGKQEIYRLMRRLTDQGISILMISSEMPELLGMSDRIALMGFINGAVTVGLKIPALVSTLATMQIYSGIAFILTRGQTIYGFPKSFDVIGKGYVGAIPVPVIIMIVIMLIGWVILNKTRLGRHTYAVGGNKEAAKLSGINVGKTTLAAFVICGLSAGIAGIIMASRVGSGQANISQTFGFEVITAVVIGGGSIDGGEGKVSGVLIGVLIIGVLSNGLVMLNVYEYYQLVIKGLVLVAAVGFDKLRQAYNLKRARAR